MAKKTALKEQGLSGGQQNKDPDVVKMVTRMQELKVKSGEISGDAKADKNHLQSVQAYKEKYGVLLN